MHGSEPFISVCQMAMVVAVVSVSGKNCLCSNGCFWTSPSQVSKKRLHALVALGIADNLKNPSFVVKFSNWSKTDDFSKAHDFCAV